MAVSQARFGGTSCSTRPIVLRVMQTRTLAVRSRKVKAVCPYKTLNISKDDTYSKARKQFLKIAMQHHPDTVGNDCEETKKRSEDIFMKSRLALESLVECGHTGKALLKSEDEADKRTMSDEEFDSWFERETGKNNPFAFDLDPEVMREVATMHSDMEGSHGLDRDGGMWHLASMVASAVKSGKEGTDMLKLEAGSANEDVEARGKLERRRKRVHRRR